LTEREGLYATWDDRKAEVDQAYHLHVFLRDARQVDSVFSSQEVHTSTSYMVIPYDAWTI